MTIKNFSRKTSFVTKRFIEWEVSMYDMGAVDHLLFHFHFAFINVKKNEEGWYFTYNIYGKLAVVEGT